MLLLRRFDRIRDHARADPARFGDDSDDRPERARNAKTEATYERMSAGSTAPEAGQIATNLAHDLRDADVLVAAQEARGEAK